MDVVQGDFVFAERFADGSVRATKGAIQKQFLDPELAGEGEYAGNKIILSDGEQVSWTPPTVKPVMPDWTQIKSLAKYFHKEGKQTWPCWFYHPSEEPIIIKDAEEAFTRFGIKRRKASDRERALQGAAEWVWETPEGCQWQPAPHAGNVPGKFDPIKGEQGKNYVPRAPDPQIAQHALIQQLVSAMQGGQNDLLARLVGAIGGAPAAPSASPPDGFHDFADPALWEEFQAFQAFKRAQTSDPPGGVALSERSPVDEEKAEWIAKAEEVGLKIDRRWSADKIRNHVMAELEKRVAEAEAGISTGGAA